jgi:hypothetical protein
MTQVRKSDISLGFFLEMNAYYWEVTRILSLVLYWLAS